MERRLAASRLNGFSASIIAGDFRSPGLATTAPQRFGTTSQSSFDFGKIPTLRPTRDERATMAGAATNASGCSISSLPSRPRRR